MNEITRAQVSKQLNRILHSRTFQSAHRPRGFLKFVVLETNEGRGDRLKEFVVGAGVFGKESSFDPRSDPIVRVHARRLRSWLETYYMEEGQRDEILIEMPKGGYSAMFRLRESPSPRRVISMPFAKRSTIAVLPFSDCSRGGGLDYFCRGVCQEIVHALAKLETHLVVAIEPSMLPPVSAKSANDLASGAAIVVSGSVRRSRDDLRVMAQMIDGASGEYIWSECLDGELGDIFEIQEEVAQAVCKRLQVRSLRDNRDGKDETNHLSIGSGAFLQTGGHHSSGSI